MILFLTVNLGKFKFTSKLSRHFVAPCNLLHIFLSIKGSDRLCKVVKLSMQCCGKLLSD